MISSISGSSSTYQTSMAQMRQKMFSRIDTNGDGKHDADELAAMAANGPKGGPAVDDILGKFDTDGDGAVSESEFDAARESRSRGAGGPPPPPMGNISSEDFAKQLFADNDTDADGVLSADELNTMVANGPEGGPSAGEILDELDTDDDGALSESELVAGAPGHGGPSVQDGSGTSTDDVFSDLDTNKDGYISQAEWQAATGGSTAATLTSGSASEIFSSILENIGSGQEDSSTSGTDSKADIASQFLSAIESYLHFSSQGFDQFELQGRLGSGLYA